METAEQRREKYETLRVTLNGVPALIQGFRRDFATVATLPVGVKFEWSWDAVERIVAKSGEFKSS